jgi:hypothetical protein
MVSSPAPILEATFSTESNRGLWCNGILPSMELAEAKSKADLILDQERIRPTVEYQEQVFVNRAELPQEVRRLMGPSLGPPGGNPVLNLSTQRNTYPRRVKEDPKFYTFKSTNFQYLVLIFKQVREEDREALLAHIIERVKLGDSALSDEKGNVFPAFGNKVSELPLVAEFAIRSGYADQLFATAAKATLMSKSLAILLIQLEDTLALNFNLFTDEQLQGLPYYFVGLLQRAESKTSNSTISGAVARRIVQSIEGIGQECEQARYFYLTGALRELPNLEIDQDRKKIESYLSTLGFDPLMQKALDEAESDYRSDASGFELKNALTHLRTFFEQLHFKVGHLLSDQAKRQRDTRCGQVLTTLRVLNFYTEKEEKFAGALYGLLSDEGVHALVAKREYARLMRNMVIEYGVMFLSMMKEKGIKLTP